MPQPAPDVAAADLADEALLLDVREDDEFAAGHAPGAVHVPLSQLPTRLDELPDPGDAPLSVVCRSGGRSAQATGFLAAAGRSVRNVDGGMQAWAAAGKPMQADDDAAPRVV